MTMGQGIENADLQFYVELVSEEEATAETTEVVETQEEGLLSPDQFAGYAVTALCTVINLLVAYFVLKRFVFKPIIKMINSRQDKIKSEVLEAEKATTEANAIREENKSQIDQAHCDAAEIIEDAKVNTEKQAEQILAKANAEVDEMMQHAQEETQRMKKAALDEMKDEISDLAVSIAGKVIGDAVSESRLKDLSDARTAELLQSRGE